jgi:hypothetical protein
VHFNFEQTYSKDSRTRAVNDSILFLQAHKDGSALLTRIIADDDLLLQIMPAAHRLFYSALQPR